MTIQPCNCEHASHPSSYERRGAPNVDFPYIRMSNHYYLQEPAGDFKASFVGPICDDCANTHMERYLV